MIKFSSSDHEHIFKTPSIINMKIFNTKQIRPKFKLRTFIKIEMLIDFQYNEIALKTNYNIPSELVLNF